MTSDADRTPEDQTPEDQTPEHLSPEDLDREIHEAEALHASLQDELQAALNHQHDDSAAG